MGLTPNSDLAGLTVRLPDRAAPPDFGPVSGDPPVVAVLPTPVPWGQDPDPTVTVTPPKPRRKGRRMVVLGAAAVLVGGAIGVLATVLGNEDSQAGQQLPSSTRQTTTTTTTQESTAPPVTPGGDPAFAPTLNPPDDQGDSVTLTWTDPTNGVAQFVVVDVTDPDDRKALITVVPGTTTYTVENLNPSADQYCFQIIGLGPDDPATQNGASSPACTNR